MTPGQPKQAQAMRLKLKTPVQSRLLNNGKEEVSYGKSNYSLGQSRSR